MAALTDEKTEFGPSWVVFVVSSIFQLLLLILIFGIVAIPLYLGARAAFAWFRHHRLKAILSGRRLIVGGWLDGSRTFTAPDWRIVEKDNLSGGYASYLVIETTREDRDDSYRPAVFFITPRQTTRGRLSKVDRVELAAANAGFEVVRRRGPFETAG